VSSGCGSFGAIKERLRPWYLRNIYFRVFPARKPAWFEECWRFPHAPIDRCEHLLEPPPASRDFLILPMTDWHARMQRSQFLAQALATQGHRCFLLNPHLGREFRGTGEGRAHLARLAPNVYELHVRLPREPVYHHRNLTAEEAEILTTSVTDLIRSAGIVNLIQIVSFPVWHQFASLVKQRHRAPIVYDCHDLLAGFAGIAPEIVSLEPRLIEQSDLVICSADSLHEHCLSAGASADRCFVVRNAVSETRGTTKAAVRERGVVVGYLGAIENWFDSEAVRAAAIARPNWRFSLGGRIESARARGLRDLPNVAFAGEIARAGVADFLGGFDVAMIPFVLNPLTLAADPIKLYEYLAAGLPVVSTRLPETQRFADYIQYYDSPGSLVDAIEKALDDGSETACARRRLAVADETWECRGRQILGLLQ
jgi:O-antigen biosynthesis protein